MKGYERVSVHILGIILLLFINIMFILNIITPDRKFSDMENRRLEEVPKFSFENLIHGKFTSNFEKYISDQFFLRDFWVGIKSDTERFIGKNENNDVFLAKDGFLIQKFHKPSNKDLMDKVNAINSFSDNIDKANKYFMLVPNSTKVLENKLPYLAPVDDELQYIEKVKTLLDKNIKFVDVYPTLKSKKDEYIFYKTDHHWTSNGAFYSYETLMKEIGYKPHVKDYFNIKKVTDDFYGSLYSKSSFRHLTPDYIELYLPKKEEKWKVENFDNKKVLNSLYCMDNLNKKDKYKVFLDGNHSLIKISTNNNNKEKLLIIKDSYANSLIPFLTGHYEEIYVVDLRYYDDSVINLIKSYNVKNVLILYNVISFFEDTSINNICK